MESINLDMVEEVSLFNDSDETWKQTKIIMSTFNHIGQVSTTSHS